MCILATIQYFELWKSSIMDQFVTFHEKGLLARKDRNKLYNPIRRNHLFQDDEDMSFATAFPDSEEAGQSEIEDMPSKVYIKF